MKKIHSLVLLVLCTAVHAFAQGERTDMRETLHFGLKAGVNYSNVYDSQGEYFQANPKFGAVAGAFLSIPINKYIGIQPEVLFSQKGFKTSGEVLTGNYGLIRTTNFIDVPLLFALKPSAFFTLLAGPQYSFLIRQTDVYSDGTSSTVRDQVFENKNLRRNILGFTGGFDVNVQHFVIGLRACWDIQNNSGDGSSTAIRYKNVWYQANFAIRF
ncbi:MAG TPA: porin family protein [Bacteroidia bacterium]|nr:porin family protein [Bacteroidia bacterium]